MSKGNSENDKSEKGQIQKGKFIKRTIRTRGNLKKDNSENEKSEKGHIWKGNIWKITILTKTYLNNERQKQQFRQGLI